MTDCIYNLHIYIRLYALSEAFLSSYNKVVLQLFEYCNKSLVYLAV